MSKTQEKKKYEMQKLPLGADLKIRFRLFLVYAKRVAKRTEKHFSLKLIAGVLVTAMFVVFVAPAQLDTYSAGRFVGKAEAAQKVLDMRKESEIYHQKLIVSEGKDKAAYVAKVKNVPIADAESVQLRHDTILEWEHGITNVSEIETDIAGKPLVVKLNLENEDHMHIFEYSPDTCDDLKRDGIESGGCLKEEIITEDYLAHRTLFDEVHNIESTYEQIVSYDPDKKQVNIRGLEYIEKTNEFYVFRTLHEGVEELYHFDEETYLLKKRVTSIIDGEERYEMSVIEIIETTFINLEKSDEIFDPTTHNFEQLEVIPL